MLGHHIIQRRRTRAKRGVQASLLKRSAIHEPRVCARCTRKSVACCRRSCARARACVCVCAAILCDMRVLVPGLEAVRPCSVYCKKFRKLLRWFYSPPILGCSFCCTPFSNRLVGRRRERTGRDGGGFSVTGSVIDSRALHLLS